MMTPTQTLSRPINILLVEDNLGDATLTYAAIKKFRTSIVLTRVPDGEEAISFLKKEGCYSGVTSPDLILLDLNMPKKTGMEVLREIKTNPEWMDIPVLVLTCSQANSDLLKAYDAKANLYLVKPPDLSGLYETMKFVEEVWFKGIQTTQA